MMSEKTLQLLLSLIGISLVGGAGFLIYKKIEKSRQNSTYNNSEQQGDPCYFVDYFDKALNPSGVFNIGSWNGTNDELLLATARAIPSQSCYNKTQECYRKRFGTTLNEAVKSDLRQYGEDETFLEFRKIIENLPKNSPNCYPLHEIT